MLNQSLGIFSNFGAVKPPLRQAADRYMPYYQKSQQNTSMKRNILFFTLLFKCVLLSAQEEITAKITIDANSNLQVTQVFN